MLFMKGSGKGKRVVGWNLDKLALVVSEVEVEMGVGVDVDVDVGVDVDVDVEVENVGSPLEFGSMDKQ